MVYLYSGTPGSGKSLHAAGDIYEAARYGSKKLIITNFSINTQKIKKQKNEILVIPNWEITVERIQQECRNFFATYYKGKIKEGKVLIFLDEAGQLFNSRDYRIAGRRDWCTFVSEHRKYGCDIYLICQFDRQLDRQIRSCIQYDLEHRKMANFGKGGKLLSLLFFGHQFAYFIADYPTGERIGKKFCKSKRKYRRIYDTFEVFSSGKEKPEQVEDEEKNDNNDNETNEQANLDNEAGNELAKVQIWEKVTKTIWKGINKMVRETKSQIFSELDKENKAYWFDLKEKKFLHTIDTFYYSVKLYNDFTANSEDPACLKFRSYFAEVKKQLIYKDDVVNFFYPGMSRNLLVKNGGFDKFYNIHLSDPKLFDIFIAEIVPPGPDGPSVTSEMIVQIRAELLWQYGVTKAFEFTFEFVQKICECFGLQIEEVKENRTDFCWHTNYLQSPEKYFLPNKMADMFVSRLGRKKNSRGTCMNYNYVFYTDGTFENNYIAVGNRGDKCFLRVYNKTREVIEMGYKAWFFQEWLFNGLINRYDFFVLEKCYEQGSWDYMPKARLQWYLEYGKKEFYKKEIRAILDEVVHPGFDYILQLANKLTPKVTTIINVEYQTMRKLTKSIEIPHLRDNESKGVTKRIYDFFDIRSLMTEYLTHDEFRLIDRTEENKSRCDYNAFWKALRSAKMVDVKKAPEEIKLQRDYTRNLDAKIVRKRALSASITYSLYMNGLNDLSPEEDAADLFCILNDNDIEYMNRVKHKRKKQLNKLLYNAPIKDKPERNYSIVKNDTGEVL